MNGDAQQRQVFNDDQVELRRESTQVLIYNGAAPVVHRTGVHPSLNEVASVFQCLKEYV
jgi:hypothetical protein